MNSGKGRKRRTRNYVDVSQKSIESFCLLNNNKNTEISEPDTTSRKYHKLPTSGFTIPRRKKQTLLAPFDEINSPNCFRVKKMERGGEKLESLILTKTGDSINDNHNDSQNEVTELSCRQAELTMTPEMSRVRQGWPRHVDDNNLYSHIESEGKDSEFDIIECCERVELSLSQEKLKHRDYNVKSGTFDSNFTQNEKSNIGCSSSDEKDSQIDIIECCEKLELSLSQEKLKGRDVRSTAFDSNLTQSESKNMGGSSGDENDSECDIIECCEKAELSLSQEKLKHRNGNVRSSAFDSNLAQSGNSDMGGSSSDEKDSECDIIECCEKAELSLSQEKLKHRNGNVRSMNAFDSNLAQSGNSNMGGSSSDEKDSECDIIECYEKAELSLSQEKLKHRNGNVRSMNAFDINLAQSGNSNMGGSSSDEKDSECDIIECCEKAELSLSQEKLKHRNDNVRSINALDSNFSQSDENESEFHIVECCEMVELSMGQLNNHVQIVDENDIPVSHFKICNSEHVKGSKDKTVVSLNKKMKSTSTESGFKNGSHQNKPVLTIDDFGMESNDSKTGIILEFCKQAESSLSRTTYSDKNADNNGCNSQNMFGLFGITSSDDEEMDSCFENEMNDYRRNSYFNEIPVEILENIFCHLPLIDLLTNLSLVCKRWYETISTEKFLLWKKRYYRYKCSFESRSAIYKVLSQEHLHLAPAFPNHLCRFLSTFRVVHEDHSNLLNVLRLHSKYHLIETFLEKDDMQPYSCWSVVGLLSLVSSSVYDIQEIIACLLRSSTCLLYDILECLHCLALIFFVLKDKHSNTFSSHHYRIYYALYLHENTSHCTQSSLESAYTANISGQQCILKYRESSETTWLTHEQVRIMNHNTNHGDVLKIVAFAGTGKTTTLVEYTKLRPSWKFLNVAYNKSVQEQAERKFPNNVESRTVHSLAYRAVGFKYRGKMTSSLRVNNIMDNLCEKSANFLHAKRVIDTLTNFICSYDDLINSEHVPYRDISSEDTDGDRSKLEFFNSDAYLKIVVRDSREIWNKMCDPDNHDVRITHDGYLKIYQLSKPVIKNFDCILVDEAQDCTPAVADILLSQEVAKILVGDPHQQIYGFRGATNAMAQVDATHVYYLTQSFRFGSEIASVASSLLDILKGVHNKNIVGVVKPGGFHGDHLGQIAIICRTNFALFNNAVLLCTRNNKTRIGFAGGIQGYNLDRVLDIYKLYSGINRGGIKDRFIKRFRSFVELKEYARKAPDPELCGKIKIVETHNINVANHVARIKNQTCKDIDQAEIVFSTAHKAKGLEFDTVRIGEDFLQDCPVDELKAAPTDEKNLLYVAVTRAKLRIQCSMMLYNILALKTDLLLTCESIKSVKIVVFLPALLKYYIKNPSTIGPPAGIEAAEDIESTYCAECKRLCDFAGSVLATKRAQVLLGTNQKMDGGFLCSKCVFSSNPLMGNLLVENK